MIASTVSSKMIGAIAKKEGFQFDETLTGFKWIGNRVSDLRAAGKVVLFSYEEAIGFCVGDVVKVRHVAAHDGACGGGRWMNPCPCMCSGVVPHRHFVGVALAPASRGTSPDSVVGLQVSPPPSRYVWLVCVCVCGRCQDKDGVCASAVFAEMAGELARRGLTVTAHLDALFREYGYFLTNNRYVFVDDPRKTVAIFTRLRNEGTSPSRSPCWPHEGLLHIFDVLTL